MITNVRCILNDGERNRLSLLINPNSPKRLATRAEVSSFIIGCLESAVRVVDETKAATPMGSNTLSRLRELTARDRATDPALKGKSMSYCMGWCRVKYRRELMP